MADESRELYLVVSATPDQMATQINQILSRVSLRLDQLEGYRGVTTFAKNQFQVIGASIGAFLRANTSTADASFEEISETTVSALADYIRHDGTRAFTGNQSMGGFLLTSVGSPSSANDAANKTYVDTELLKYILKDGTRAFTGDQSMGSNKLTNVADATASGDAASFGFLNNIINVGIWAKGAVSDDGTLDVSWDGNFVIYDGTAAGLNTISSGSGTCTNNAVNYLRWQSSAPTVFSLSTSPASTDVIIAHISCQDSDIYDLHQNEAINTLSKSIQNGLFDNFPALVTSGCVVQEDTDVTNAFDVALTAGTYYHDVHIEHTVAEILSRTKAMRRWYHSAGAWTSDTDSQIDTGFYDDGTNKAAVAVGKYYKWLFFFSDDTIHAVYPDAEYNTEAAALAADPPSMPPGLANLPKSSTYVFKTGDAAFDDTRWADVRPMLGVGTGGGGGVSTFLELSDTPSAFTSSAYKFPVVNSGATALEFMAGLPILTSLPASPYDGQLVRHQVTGRDVIAFWNNGSSIWETIYAFSSITYYVDSAGTDTYDDTQGTATGASAFATIPYAIQQVPDGGVATINVGSGTFSDAIADTDLVGKGSITVVGTLSTTESLTAAASTRGGTSTQGTVVRNSGTWTANQRQNKLVRFTSGNNNGETHIIDSNTTTTITIVGAWLGGVISGGETFDVLDWGTTISGFVEIGENQTSIEFQDIAFTSNSGVANSAGDGGAQSAVTLTRCNIDGGWRCAKSGAQVTYDTTFINANTTDLGCYNENNTFTIMTKSKVTGGQYGARVLAGARFALWNGSIIDSASTYGIWIDRNSTARFGYDETVVSSYSRTRDCAIHIQAQRMGTGVFTAIHSFDGTGTTKDWKTGTEEHGWID